MRKYQHIGVGIVLLGILVLGGKLISNLNQDARQIEFTSELAQRGQELATAEGCIACHTMDGSPGIGPTWLGMFGKTETLVNGQTIVVDEAYFRESLRNPATKQVEGYPNVMLRYFLDDEDVDALIEFTRQLATPQLDK